MEFTCTFKNRSWLGKIEILKASEHLQELLVSGDGLRFHLLIGDHAFGSFLCEPRLGICCELSHFSDRLWNRQSISQYFSPADTETLVNAISLLDQSSILYIII